MDLIDIAISNDGQPSESSPFVLLFMSFLSQWLIIEFIGLFEDDIFMKTHPSGMM